ncbi:MAG: DUF1287 domain-containing protein [Verrucomicrobiota bacterium]
MKSTTLLILLLWQSARLEAAPPLVEAARQQIGITTRYDPSYVLLDYPNGDVAPQTGVCTDVVVRAFREAFAVDLQKAIHEDMRAHFASYPQRWGLAGPDPHIDHRRVPNQATWFARQGWEKEPTPNPADYAPGDLVTWDLNGQGLLHIGILSDRRSPAGHLLVLHNIGRGTAEEDLLFHYTILQHFRPPQLVAKPPVPSGQTPTPP